MSLRFYFNLFFQVRLKVKHQLYIFVYLYLLTLLHFPSSSPTQNSLGNLPTAELKSSGVASQRYPVTPFFTVSIGPPLLQAITGLYATIASNGTIPKCSS
ncbi:unnamed protein product [Brassica oleracea var. botrytis]